MPNHNGVTSTVAVKHQAPERESDMQQRTNDEYNLVTAPVLVTGGTGRLGRLVVPRLREAGQHVRVLSRHNHETKGGIAHITGNLLTDEGIESALAEAETIVHLAGASNAKGDDQATRNLVRAASRAGVRHLVYISVIGADRMPLGYFRNKLAAELAVADSGLPWTTLRSAQVHDLVLTLVRGMAKLPVIPIPGGLRFQPVDPDEVAARLVELTLNKPAGLVPDLAGPDVYDIRDLIRGYLQATGKHRVTMPVRIPGKVGRAYRAGENLSPDAADLGKRTWEDFLAGRLHGRIDPLRSPAKAQASSSPG
jgi:uncharacterized protein YbjT (DUF2867 family)